MAIDTEVKLKSMIGLNYFAGPGFELTDTVDQEYLQALCYSYLGILFEEAEEVVTPEAVLSRMAIVKSAIRDLLINDSTYLGYLGDPTTDPYGTYYLYPPNPPSFPFVVFAMRPAISNPEMGRGITSRKITVDFNIWSQDGDYELIAERIIYLLNHTGDDSGFHMVYDGERNELYDEQLNAYGVSITFSIFYRKER